MVVKSADKCMVPVEHDTSVLTLPDSYHGETWQGLQFRYFSQTPLPPVEMQMHFTSYEDRNFRTANTRQLVSF